MPYWDLNSLKKKKKKKGGGIHIHINDQKTIIEIQLYMFYKNFLIFFFFKLLKIMPSTPDVEQTIHAFLE